MSFLLFFCCLSSAELNLVVTATLDGKVTDVFVQTNEEALTGYDVYDLEYPPFPVSSPRIYSIIEGNRELIMDSWKSENRELKLVYSRDEEDIKDLQLEFNGDVSGTFKVILHDYGRDSSYNKEVGASLLTGNSIYNVETSETKRYFLLEVDYLYCGDGICSDDENCSVCSVDCLGCETVAIADPYHFLTVSEIEAGISDDFTFDEGYKFNFKNEIHFVKIISITNESVKLLVASNPIELNIKWGEEMGVDIDSDLVSDFTLKPTLIGNNIVNLYFKGDDFSNFDEISNEEKKIVPTKISIFDKVYGKDKPIWLRIVVSVGLLIIGLVLLIFSLYLLRCKIKNKGLSNITSTSSRDIPIIPQPTSSNIPIPPKKSTDVLVPDAVSPSNIVSQPSAPEPDIQTGINGMGKKGV